MKQPVLLAAFLFLGTVGACSLLAGKPDDNVQLVAVGDSILAWNRLAGQDVPKLVGQQTGLVAFNGAISGAEFLGGGGIPSQYPQGDWDWVLVNGGGNDMDPFCGNPAATLQIVDLLIDGSDLSGAYRDFVGTLRANGAQVVIMGYAPISAEGGPFAGCAAELTELNNRQRRLADAMDGVYFVDIHSVIAPANMAAYDDDLIHPSPAGGALMAQAVALAIGAAQEAPR